MSYIRKSTLGLLVPVLLLAAVLPLSGCKEGVEPTEIDRALASFRELPEAEREPALREAAAAIDPDAKYAWYELGNIYYQRAQQEQVAPGEGSPTAANALLDSALVFFTNATELDTTFVEALVNSGLIWDDVCDGRTPEARQAMMKAVKIYERAIALRPADEKARCNLGALFFRKRQPRPALEQFQAVLDVNPESALAHFNLAIMFADSKMYREAIVEWELAAKYDDGEIRERANENIQVMKDLMETEIPETLTTRTEVQGK